MGSKIIDRLLADVEYECTRKGSPDVRIGVVRIPEHLRVPQVLGDWVVDGWL